jgi:hypothetical protein
MTHPLLYHLSRDSFHFQPQLDPTYPGCASGGKVFFASMHQINASINE